MYLDTVLMQNKSRNSRVLFNSMLRKEKAHQKVAIWRIKSFLTAWTFHKETAWLHSANAHHLFRID